MKRFFGYLKDAFREVDLMNELCEYLREETGVNAVLAEQGSPETGLRSRTMGIFGSPALGVLKITGRGIDAIEIDRINSTYLYHYVVLTGLGNVSDELKAKMTQIKRGLLKHEVVGLEWKGAQLANTLNNDGDLIRTLYQELQGSLEIHPDEKHRCVRITRLPLGCSITFGGGIATRGQLVPDGSVNIMGQFVPTYGRRAFPTPQALWICERIAEHIRTTSHQSSSPTTKTL
jgi:hypothetical protein